MLAKYVDWISFDAVAIAAFGYRINEQPQKIREDLSSIMTLI
ncbi:hypothetical protein [Silvanigrella aquatica]|nr:hypothetical protein [Silvanigrella aquatica]